MAHNLDDLALFISVLYYLHCFPRSASHSRIPIGYVQLVLHNISLIPYIPYVPFLIIPGCTFTVVHAQVIQHCFITCRS